MRKTDTLARWIATWFGVGFTPKAPGTAGAAAAFPVHWCLVQTGAASELMAIALICCLGVWSAENTRRILAEDDPQIIVVDEVAGTLIALFAAGNNFPAQMIAFIAFRVFDIFKPWPIDRLEHLPHGGMAIMADDIFAGLLAAGCAGLWLHLSQ